MPPNSYLSAALLLSHFTFPALSLPTDSEQQFIHWSDCGTSLDSILKANNWTKFENPVECGTVTVPLDYTDTSRGELNLSLVRVKALTTELKGSILFNPGGPGHSGIEYVASSSRQIHDALNGSFNLIGLDTRGTGNTIPFACNISELIVSETTSSLKARSMPTANLTEHLLSTGWSTTSAFAAQCAKDNSKYGDVITSAFVSRDLLHIVDALHEDGLLNFWGMSYGTLLGMTFASMFPDRVGHMVLDAVGNIHEYSAGPYFTMLDDSEKTYRGYLDECIATPSLCSIAQYFGTNTTSSQLEEAIGTAISNLNNGSLTPPTIVDTYLPLRAKMSPWDVKSGILSGLYATRSWQPLTAQLKALLDGNTDNPPNANATDAVVPYNRGTNALQGIQCSDTTWRASSAEQIIDVVRKQSEDNMFGDVFYQSTTWPCAAWKIQPKERFAGPFGGNTRTPILFVNAEHDPVTSLNAAENATATFGGSRLLKSNGFGHGTLGHPSACIKDKLRRYFERGELPEIGTVCEVDEPGFVAGVRKVKEAVAPCS